MSTPAINVVPISPENTSEIVSELRKLADNIHLGTISPRTVWLILDTPDGMDQYCLGYKPYLQQTIGALEFAKFIYMKKEMRR